jgi:hypothetical protein
MSNGISQPPILDKEIIENSDICCFNCELLKLKLQEVSSELRSAQEIIKILQEEDNPNQRASDKPRGPQHNLEEKQPPTEDLYSSWTIFKPNRKTRIRNYVHPKQEVFPPNVNRYNVLRTLVEPQVDDLPNPHNILTTFKKHSGKNSVKSGANHRKRRKIVIIGDSHAKGCAANIKYVLGKTEEVTGYVSPGSKLENITNIAKKEINELTKKDTVVIWGGANNIAINESEKGLTYLSNFVELCKNTNVIIIDAPKRHDLLESSCVNEEVDKFNRKLHKKMRVFEHAKVIDSVTQRECYTRHGLHLNSLGKEQMAHRIIEQLKNSLMNNNISIPLPWKVMPLVYNPTVSTENNSKTNDNDKDSTNRNSNRPRKAPVTRTEDFLWETTTSRTRPAKEF